MCSCDSISAANSSGCGAVPVSRERLSSSDCAQAGYLRSSSKITPFPREIADPHASRKETVSYLRFRPKTSSCMFHVARIHRSRCSMSERNFIFVWTMIPAFLVDPPGQCGTAVNQRKLDVWPRKARIRCHSWHVKKRESRYEFKKRLKSRLHRE